MNITFLGDLTVDTYPDQGKIHLGGSSLNSAMWAKRMGATPSVIAAVGMDGAGKSFLAKLDEEGIHRELVQALPGKTSSIDIFLDEKGERTYGSWNPGVLVGYHLGDAERMYLKGQQAALLIVYGPTIHLLSEYLTIAKQKSTSQVFGVDFGDFTQFEHNTELIREAGAVADVLFFGLTAGTDRALVSTLQEYARDMHAVVVVTLADAGSIAFQRSHIIKQKTKTVDVVDATGAGDAYIAGFMMTYVAGRDVQKAMLVGTNTALRALKQLGAY